MQRIRKRTEITVETEETVIFRASGQANKGWCAECATLSITGGPNSNNQTIQTVDLGGNGTP